MSPRTPQERKHCRKVEFSAAAQDAAKRVAAKNAAAPPVNVTTTVSPPSPIYVQQQRERLSPPSPATRKLHPAPFVPLLQFPPSVANEARAPRPTTASAPRVSEKWLREYRQTLLLLKQMRVEHERKRLQASTPHCRPPALPPSLTA